MRMYTLSSSGALTPRTRLLALVLLVVVPSVVRAQDPQRLRGVDVTAKRPGPGPRLVGGMVRDTAKFPLEGVELIIPELQRRLLSREDGSFRFADVPRGSYSVRARKFGYAPQIRQIDVDSMGAASDFELVPAPRALPSVVVSAARGGLSGTVADTAYDYILGADVIVLGKDLRAMTDSTGSFYLPVPEGHYMVAVKKAGYADRLVSVTIPADSGRRISTFMMPQTKRNDPRETNNVLDLEQRMAWGNKTASSFYTREDLKRMKIEFAYEAMNTAGQATFDLDCSVIIDGGPTTANVSTLSIDDIESVEVFSDARLGKNPRPSQIGGRGGQRPMVKGIASFKPALEISNTQRATAENLGKHCPSAVYIWSR